jgi:hypothetical protein
MSSAITVRQQLARRPGSLYGTEPRSLVFGRGSLFSFPLHSTAYEADAATVRIPAGVKLRLTSASVDRKEMSDFLRNTGKAANGGVSLRFSSEENGDMIPVCTFDGERSGDLSQTGLGIEGVLRALRCYTFAYRWHSLCRFKSASNRGPGLRSKAGAVASRTTIHGIVYPFLVNSFYSYSSALNQYFASWRPLDNFFADALHPATPDYVKNTLRDSDVSRRPEDSSPFGSSRTRMQGRVCLECERFWIRSQGRYVRSPMIVGSEGY